MKRSATDSAAVGDAPAVPPTAVTSPCESTGGASPGGERAGAQPESGWLGLRAEPAGSVAPVEPELPESVRDDLAWIVGQIQHGAMSAALAAVGSLPGGLRGFYVLGAAADGAAPNQIEVARRFNIDRTVMVRLVDDMERAGLVERRPDPSDRRARMIMITERGAREHAAARERLQAVDGHLLAPLSPADREVFRRLARTVAAHLMAADPSRGAAACASAEARLAEAAGDCAEPTC